MGSQTWVDIQVVGKGWYGQTLATEMTVKIGNGPFLTNIQPTKDDIEDYLTSHTGDFKSITDWAAVAYHQERKTGITTTTDETVKEWDSEDDDCTFLDCMYPSDDD